MGPCQACDTVKKSASEWKVWCLSQTALREVSLSINQSIIFNVRTMAVGSNNTGHMSDNRLAHGYGKHLWGICIERRHSCDELIQYGSQAPPVHLSTMPCAQQQLRRQVVGSPHCAPLLFLHAAHMPYSCMSQALMMPLTSCRTKFEQSAAP